MVVRSVRQIVLIGDPEMLAAPCEFRRRIEPTRPVTMHHRPHISAHVSRPFAAAVVSYGRGERRIFPCGHGHGAGFPNVPDGWSGRDYVRAVGRAGIRPLTVPAARWSASEVQAV